MANDVRVRLSLAGLNRLMRSEPIQRKVTAEAARIASRAGDKFQVEAKPHRWTARAYAETKKGVKLTDADRLALLRAVRGEP